MLLTVQVGRSPYLSASSVENGLNWVCFLDADTLCAGTQQFVYEGSKIY